MIARCETCDLKRMRRDWPHHTGYRYRGPLDYWRCPECGGPLRGKRHGDTEALILDAVPVIHVDGGDDA